MNILRRVQVVAGTVAATAVVGAVSGIVVASALLAMRLAHISPQLLWEVLKLGGQTGAAFGVMLGAPLTFALLRRAPLSRIASSAFVAATVGGFLGYAISLPFAQPRPSVDFMLTGSCLAVGMAAARLWAKFRGAHNTTAVPSAG